MCVYVIIERAGIEIEVEVGYSITHYGSPGNCWDDPGEAPEWDIDSLRTMYARIPLDYDLDLTAEEQSMVESAVAEDGDFEPCEDDYDLRSYH